MARVKDLSCNRCGKLMWRGPGVLTEGKARCQPCRRIEPQPSGVHTAPRLIPCEWCGWMFIVQYGRRAQRFCTMACFGKSNQVRADDDQHQLRCERARNAPGLSSHGRGQLLKRWMRQGRTCAYCDALATTVDHVVPLVRGGTNYEGNLVPCCKRCNSSKQHRFIIEWRMGKRATRMTSALTWTPTVKAIKVKPPKVTHPCPLCSTLTIRRIYCSDDCARESSARTTRDAYRAAHGLLVDRSRPTRPTKRGKTVQFLISA